MHMVASSLVPASISVNCTGGKYYTCISAQWASTCMSMSVASTAVGASIYSSGGKYRRTNLQFLARSGWWWIWTRPRHKLPMLPARHRGTRNQGGGGRLPSALLLPFLLPLFPPSPPPSLLAAHQSKVTWKALCPAM